MKVREQGGERGIGHYVNEEGETRESEGAGKKDKEVTCSPSGAVIGQHIPVYVCACVCAWWVTLGTMALYLCVWLWVCNVEHFRSCNKKAQTHTSCLPDKQQPSSLKYQHLKMYNVNCFSSSHSANSLKILLTLVLVNKYHSNTQNIILFSIE